MKIGDFNYDVMLQYIALIYYISVLSIGFG